MKLYLWLTFQLSDNLQIFIKVYDLRNLPIYRMHTCKGWIDGFQIHFHVRKTAEIRLIYSQKFLKDYIL